MSNYWGVEPFEEFALTINASTLSPVQYRYRFTNDGELENLRGGVWFKSGIPLARLVSGEYKIIKQKASELKESCDFINHPSHYTSGKVECIDAIESAVTDLQGIEAVCTANVIKYMWRWKQKNGIEDLKKAEWYLKKLIAINNNTDKIE